MIDWKHILPLLIPLLSIALGIGLAMFGLWLDYRKKTQLVELHHKERLLALERGQELPPLPEQLLGNVRRPESLLGTLRWGLIWLMVGMAVALAMLNGEDSAQAVWAGVPIAIGLAQLITYVVAIRQSGHGNGVAKSVTLSK